MISICKQNRLVAILEVHDTTGADDTYSLEQAVNYWIEMKSLLQQNENYVIVNIANEWYGTWDDGTSWKNGYIFAIRKLREAGINNTFIVDCAGWGQYPQVIFDHGSSVLQADVKNNTMFSIHMYEYAGGNSDIVKNNMNQVLNKNLCLTIGEFGGYHSNGDVDEDETITYIHSSTSKGPILGYMNLKYPDLARKDGKVINSYLRRGKRSSGTDSLASYCFNSYGTIFEKPN